MNDVVDQIRAWADAAAPVDAAPGVRSDEIASVSDLSARRPSPRLLAVAVLVFVAALAGVVLATNRDDPQSVTAGPTEDTAEASPVTFEVLSVTAGYLNDLGVLRSASSGVQLAGLWDVAGATEPVPTIDFDEQVVVSITIPDDTCPPTLEAFDRVGSDLTPRFIESSGGCDDDLLVIPRTYVVALDQSTTGPEFRLVLAGQPQYEFGETFLHVGGVVPGVAGATAAFHLSADTMAAGSTIAGTVQVYNNSAEPIERTTCGSYFVALLESEVATQTLFRPACLQSFVIPSGSSSYPVTVKATYLTCNNGEASDVVPACLPDGTMPALPPGIYEARVDQGADPIEVSGPLTVTVT